MHTVGDIFQHMGDYFKMYKIYCANQQIAVGKVTELVQKNVAFKNFLKECNLDPRSRKLGLTDFLIKPVQRICKYPLLFKELARNTPEDHSDYISIMDAKKKIEDIVNYINEGQRKYESQQRIVAIQNIIDGVNDLIAPTRVFLQEGILGVQLSLHDRPLDHQVFLFNDLLVIAKKKAMPLMYVTKEYYLVARLPLDTAALAWSEGSTDFSGKKFMLEVLSSDKETVGSGKGILFSAKDENQTRAWFERICKAIDDIRHQTDVRKSIMMRSNSTESLSKKDLAKSPSKNELQINEVVEKKEEDEIKEQ